MKHALRKLYRTLKKINDLKEQMQSLSEEELRGMTDSFKKRLKDGESLESILVEAYAVAREAAMRVLGKFPYDEQVLAGIAMFEGKLVEMKTGEGKTLTATLPLYLHALTGKSTILLTSNDYLARRDGEEMGLLYRYLGLSIGISVPEGNKQFTSEEKKEIYSSDIVYTTHSILTFDYLLENLAVSKADRYMRPFYFVLIDEVDSVFLDAANMPLVISGAPRVQSNLYKNTDYFVSSLDPEEDYVEEDKQVWLTQTGFNKARRFFGVHDLYTSQYYEILRHISLALKAHVLMKRDEDYLVNDGTIALLDAGSGRMVANTKLKAGQHQAIEVKEGLDPSREMRAMASITYQAFFRLFEKKAGMSGSIATDKKELKSVYDMDVVVIPTHRPVIRKDLPDRYFGSFDGQFNASMEELLKAHEKGQPVLVVTSSIEMSYLYSQTLLADGIPHNVLNAYNVPKEAEIIKNAGVRNAVTIATAIAGRGTDIKLGKGVEELGGLYVLGIGRMANKRLETQARGRSGRQGDPGCSQFFVCLDDKIVQDYGAKSLQKYSDRDEIKRRHVVRLIDHAQRNNEVEAYRARMRTLEYDSSTSAQRTIIYKLRNDILDDKLTDDVHIESLIEQSVDAFIASQPDEAQVERYILDHIQYKFDRSLDYHTDLKKTLMMIIHDRLNERKNELAPKQRYPQYVRICVLNALDNAWIEQVDYLEQLKAAVSYRHYAQKNVIYEFHQDAYRGFEKMLKTARENALKNIMLSFVVEKQAGSFTVILP